MGGGIGGGGKKVGKVDALNSEWGKGINKSNKALFTKRHLTWSSQKGRQKKRGAASSL